MYIIGMARKKLKRIAITLLGLVIAFIGYLVWGWIGDISTTEERILIKCLKDNGQSCECYIKAGFSYANRPCRLSTPN